MKFTHKTDFSFYVEKDRRLAKALGVRDFLALGVGTVISTSIFTLPGIVAASHAGPAVALSFVISGIVAGIVAFAYAEMACVMPFAGSAYSWISVVFGEGFGWIAGWALLAEYLIAVAFVASGFSGYLRGMLHMVHVDLPAALANPFGTNGGFVDIISLAVILVSVFVVFRGASDAGMVSQILVVLKLIAIVVFIAVGVTVLHPENYVPFIPPHNPDTGFGGIQGVLSGAAGIFVAYIGFDSIAANSGEAKDPGKTMPRGILGSLITGVVLFAIVSLVLVGMFKYSLYADNSAPVGWALTQAGHPIIAELVSATALTGMFVALLGMELAGSRLLYAFGRDGMMPTFFGKLSDRHLPSNALAILTIVTVLIGAFFPFALLSRLISTGTLIAFMFASLGIFALRPREGKDLPAAVYKMPFYPVLPILGFLGSLGIFVMLGHDALIMAGAWFVLGLVIYFAYGARHRVTRRDNNGNT